MNNYLDETGLYVNKEWMDFIDGKLREVFDEMKDKPMTRSEYLILKDHIVSTVDSDLCFTHWENWPQDEIEKCCSGGELK